MNNIVRKSISEFKEFDRCGYHYTKVSEGNNFYLFKMENEDSKCKRYEIWRGKKYKQPDGSIVYARPGDEDFGVYGWYICGSSINKSLNRLKNEYEDFPYNQFKQVINS